MSRRLPYCVEFARDLLASAISAWSRLSLSLKFASTASIVVAIGMVTIGHWVATRIEDGVVNNAATAAAAYVDKYITPHLQELAVGSEIGEEHRRALNQLLSPEAATKPILSFRIWKGNTVVYSDRKELVGKSFKETPSLARAWQGATVGEFEHMSDEHGAGFPSAGSPVLEIYAPVRAHGTNRIIALAETYEIATELKRELTRAQSQSWLLVATVSLVILGSLFGIVRNGSRTIEQQRHLLEQRVAELSRLLGENDELRSRVSLANQRVADSNERLLHRIGADLHDGPVQLLGLALLKLEDFCEVIEETNKAIFAKTDAPNTLRSALMETLEEIRNLSAGLGPPDIENLSVRDTLQLVARKHEQRTGTPVKCNFGFSDASISFPIKTCIYRFAQEGLNNAFQHAGGSGQSLFAEYDGAKLEVRVVDRGPGISVSLTANPAHKQGLNGLRDRIESLGGTFELLSEPGQGTCLTARFSIPPEVTA